MLIKQFESYAELHGKVLGLLKEHSRLALTDPHAIVLPGGRTPFGIYSDLADSPPHVDRRLHLILSDERHVLPSSPDSNYGRMLPLFERAGVDPRQIVHPNTTLPLEDCADEYDHRLTEFFERNGRITLCLLGVGTDGHTASLFDMAALEPTANDFAIPVRKENPPDRVSLTANVLNRSERVIFLCAGAVKNAIVERIEKFPEEVVAAQAVSGVENVELWHSE